MWWGADALERVNMPHGEQNEFPEGLLDEMNGNMSANRMPRNDDQWDAFADRFNSALSELYEIVAYLYRL